ANKDMVQLQTQVQQLQEQMTAMQRGFDERMGVMKNLVEQDTDAVNKVANAPKGVEARVKKQGEEGGPKPRQFWGQNQSPKAPLEKIKGGPAKGHKTA